MYNRSVFQKKNLNEDLPICLQFFLTFWNNHICFAAGQNSQLDSPQTQARHYRALQEMYKTKKPNKSAVVQLLDLEFQSRRAFIDSDVMKEQDRPTKVLEAYPCFREIDHVSCSHLQIFSSLWIHWIFFAWSSQVQMSHDKQALWPGKVY